MMSTSLLALVAQALLAAGSVIVMVRFVLPALSSLRQPEVFTHVWIPILCVGPLVMLAVSVDGTVAGVGWAPVGAPAALGLLAVGAALAARVSASIDIRAAVACAGVGLLLLLLSAVNDLTIWTGQVSFAVAAVVLWMNTPGVVHHGPHPGLSAASLGLLVAFVLMLGQGLCALVPDGWMQLVAAAIGFGHGAAILLLLVRRAGPARGLLVGSWVAGIGTLLGIGLLSIVRMTPQALSMVAGATEPVRTDVAFGFGRYALEAVVMMLIPVVAAGAGRMPTGARRALGVLLVLAALALAVTRVT